MSNNKTHEAMNSKFETLSQLEKSVLLDILEEQKQDRGFTSWQNAYNFGKTREEKKYLSFAAGAGSLQRKRVIKTNAFRHVFYIDPEYLPA